jgi:hypothetical protein
VFRSGDAACSRAASPVNGLGKLAPRAVDDAIRFIFGIPSRERGRFVIRTVRYLVWGLTTTTRTLQTIVAKPTTYIKRDT